MTWRFPKQTFELWVILNRHFLGFEYPDTFRHLNCRSIAYTCNASSWFTNGGKVTIAHYSQFLWFLVWQIGRGHCFNPKVSCPWLRSQWVLNHMELVNGWMAACDGCRPCPVFSQLEALLSHGACPVATWNHLLYTAGCRSPLNWFFYAILLYGVLL